MNETQTIESPEAKKPRMKITLTGVCISAMLLCGLLVGILPQTLLALAVLACAAVLVVSRGIWLAFPIMIFYYESFGMLFGMSVFRYFTFLFLLFFVISRQKFTLRFYHVAPMLVFAVYCILVIIPYDVRRALFAVLDAVCILILINCFLKNFDSLKKFFSVYVITAICSFITGVIINGGRVITQNFGGEIVEITRNYGTFEDPNYMGLFFSVALFAMMSLSLFHPIVRAILAVSLSAMILTTLSVTALILNVVFWLVYLFIFKKINIATLCCIAFVIVILLSLFSYGLANPDTPIIGGFSLRIEEKLSELSVGNINEVTTGRTDLTLYHWKYFEDQSIFKMLFGMNAASVIKTDLGGFTGAAHNEYIDLLLNIGVLGAMLYLGVILFRAFKTFVAVRREGDKYSGCIFMMKLIWLGYAATLTMFGDYRFMLLFFI